MKSLSNLLSITIAIVFLGGAPLFAKDASVAYKTKKTLSKSFQKADDAAKRVQTLEKLGCKVSSSQSGGMVVVQYECPKWRSVPASSEKIAHQWETWLREAGFDVVHGHGENHEDAHGHGAHTEGGSHAHSAEHGHGNKREELQFRLAKKVTLHPEKEGEYEELVAILKGLGCTIKNDSHDGHADLEIRCESWRHVEFTSHQSAMEWDKWLKNFGFEVKQSHDHH